MKKHACDRCGQRIFFENVHCEQCHAALGFDPGTLRMRAFDVDADGAWHFAGGAEDGAVRLRPCVNYVDHNVCNWLVPVDDPNPLCCACRTTRVLPDLARPGNLVHWGQLEAAKRRMFYGLLRLGLPVPSRGEDPAHGVAFEFLETLDPAARVMTGHDEGLITLNVAEADDVEREAARARMHEPSRTLLGHFRHEIGHYYWDRLVRDLPALDRYRALFGDERADYPTALRRHYEQPRTDWMLDCISAYASSHPWEDWAECFAHYLHMQDGLETAANWGLRLQQAVPGSPAVVAQSLQPGTRQLERSLVESWLPISQFVNAMSRSLGTRDSYPFVVPPPVVDKLAFIHEVIHAGVSGEAPMNFTPRSAQPRPGGAPADAAVAA